MLVLAGVHAALSCLIGLQLYAHLSCSIAPAIVVAGLGLFLLAWLFGPADGIIVKRVYRKRALLEEEAA